MIGFHEMHRQNIFIALVNQYIIDIIDITVNLKFVLVSSSSNWWTP